MRCAQRTPRQSSSSLRQSRSDSTLVGAGSRSGRLDRSICRLDRGSHDSHERLIITERLARRGGRLQHRPADRVGEKRVAARRAVDAFDIAALARPTVRSVGLWLWSLLFPALAGLSLVEALMRFKDRKEIGRLAYMSLAIASSRKVRPTGSSTPWRSTTTTSLPPGAGLISRT